MAKFCQYCGSELKEGVKFCTQCGAPVSTDRPEQSPIMPQPQESSQPQPQPQPMQQPNYSQQSMQRNFPQQPIQPVYQQPVPPKTKKVKKKKKGKGCLVTLIVFLVIIAIGAVLFFGFRDGGWFRRKSPADLESLRAYAERLEKDGNKEAAAAIYDLIAKSGGEMIQKAHEDIPVLDKADEIDQFGQIFGN